MEGDNANCGTRGNACPAGGGCAGGLTCQSGPVACDGTCIDPGTDRVLPGTFVGCSLADSTADTACPDGGLRPGGSRAEMEARACTVDPTGAHSSLGSGDDAAGPACDEGIPNLHREAVELAAATLLYVAATIAVFWPLVRSISSALLGPPEDNMQDLWNTWYGVHALDEPGRDFFRTALVRFPEGASLRFHSFSFPHLAVVYLFGKAFQVALNPANVIALHNAALLMAVPVAALGVRAAARRLGADPGSATVAGLLFAFGSFEIAQIQHHVHTSQVQFVPWFVLATWNATDDSTPHRWRWVATTAALLAAASLASWYYLVYGGLFLAFHVAFLAVQRGVRAARPAAISSGLAAVGAAVLVGPLAIPMMLEGTGNPASLGDGHSVFVVDLAGWFAFPSHHLLANATAALRSRFTGNPWESEMYVGIVAAGLFAWALAARRRPGLERTPYLLAGMACFAVVATGSVAHAFGRPLGPAPARLLELVPIAQNARTPGRAAVFVQLFLAVGVGLALTAIRSRTAAPTLRRATTAGLVVLLLLDTVPASVAVTRVMPPEAYDLIAHDPGRFAVLDLPLGYLPGNRGMLAQVFHGKPIVSASLSRHTSPSLADRLWLGDVARLRAQLAKAGVKFVVLHRDMLYSEMWARDPSQEAAILQSLESALNLEYESRFTNVYRTY